jgi:diaminopimelate epimerase
MLPFSKYHGAGNDFVLLDYLEAELPADLADLAVRLCHRRLGLGADGILLLLPAREPASDVTMRIINSDGSEAEMCGNGLRCLVKHALEADPQRGDTLVVDTGAGALECQGFRNTDGLVERVRETMGRPILERSEIPLAGEGAAVREPLAHPDGRTFHFTGVSMGNPHAVIFLDSGDPVELALTYGPALERHERFPSRANIEFVRPRGLLLESAVWERGAGLTAACGTGACAIGVAAGLEERVAFGTEVTVSLPGGELAVEVAPDLSQVWLAGPAALVARGQVDPDHLAPAAQCRALTAALGAD